MKHDTLKLEALEFDIFRPEDARGIGDLFRSVYGNGYPVRLVYNAAALVEAFDKKENIPLVARTEDGKIVAHEALYRSTPNPQVYEAGQGLVLAELRSSGIGGKMNEYLCEVVVPGFDMEALFGEAVCNHVHMQKSWSKLKNIESAIEVDLMPQETYVAEGSVTGRVATLAMFRIYKEREQTVYLPSVYTDQFRFLYDGFSDEAQSFQTGHNNLPLEPSKIETQVFDFAGVARMTVKEPGIDFEAALSREEKKLIGQGVVVFQIWLNLSWPFIDGIIDILRRQGYFFGGLLPRWFGEDGMLMQKATQRPNWEGIQLYSDRAREILRLVQEDWSRIGNSAAR